LVNRGNALRHLKRYAEALESYARAIVLEPKHASAFLGRANVLFELEGYSEAAAVYDEALVLKSDLIEAWIGRGNCMAKLRQYIRALAAYDEALTRNPSSAHAWLGRGNLLLELKRYSESIAAYDRALELQPGLAEARFGLGNIYLELKRYDKAFAAYDETMRLKADLPELEAVRLHTKMHLCNWKNFDCEYALLLSKLRSKTAVMSPFVLLALPSSAQDQLECAALFAAKNLPGPDNIVRRISKHDHERIRIAYMSADFRQHPISHLIAGLFENHDKSKFELIGLSFGPVTDDDDMQHRVKASLDTFIDVQDQTDLEVALLARNLEVDIAVDLMGFTEFNRAAILAMRAAPLQVNYLGYPGTMGASFMDYIIADSTVIPALDQRFYAEKVVYLPYSYQANDAKRSISDREYKRAEVGLPKDGFVFCCFNNSYKITPDVFAMWMRILKAIEKSVLWLIESNSNAVANLRNTAMCHGVSPERLVFAKRMRLPDHLARHRLADLFLDTSPYNAHTTASDSLWAGVPVLSQIGETFAGRVGASLLNAIGLRELVVPTAQAYESLAIELASNPPALACIRSKLADQRCRAPLFDTKLFTKHIELAYRAMYDTYKAGLPPAPINIQAMT
jgi:predicted O-linked N-acetylglucosamine transferase (SPINDLY family)